MTERTLIGQATTNSNGIATLEYTGTGAGDLNIVAVAGDVESNVIQVEDYEPVATDLSIEALTPIVEVGDTISLKTILLDQYGEGIPSKAVTVTVGSSEYTSNTNSQGVASFSISDLSSSGVYTFEASYGSLTASCTVQNCIQINAIDSTDWYVGGAVETVATDGTVFTTTTSYGYALIDKAGTGHSTWASSQDWEAPFCFEMDILEKTGTISAFIHEGTDNIEWVISNVPSPLKLSAKDGTMYYYLDDTLVTSKSYTGTTFRVGLKISANSSVKFKNGRIYTI